MVASYHGAVVGRVALALMLGCTAGSGGDEGSFGEAGSDGSGTPASSGTSTGGTTPAEGSDSGSAGTDAATCGGTCMPIPDGWFGPAVIARRDAPPPCADGYPEAGLALLEGYTAPPKEGCECSCAPDPFGTCKLTMETFTADGCSELDGDVEFGTQCANGSPTGWGQLGVPTGEAMDCEATTETNLPDPTWDATVSTCRTSEETAAGCSDGVCVPEVPPGFEAQVCIFAEGEQACPDGFADALTLYSGIDDSRFCSVCACGSVDFDCAAEPATVTAYDDTNCDGEEVGTVQTGACEAIPAGAQSFGLSFDDPPGCPVKLPPMVLGEIMPTGAFTYCCQ